VILGLHLGLRTHPTVIDGLSAVLKRSDHAVSRSADHGCLCGFPEAKFYLDTAHEAVPGYLPLT
jgi:hypothetical protein